MRKLAEQFRHANLNRRRNGPPTARYSKEQRQLALRYLDEARERGSNPRQVAKDLGIDSNTLRSWEKHADGGRPHGKRPRSMIPVQLTTPENGSGDESVPFVIRTVAGVSIECASAGCS